MISRNLAFTGLLLLLAGTSAQADPYQRGDVFKLDLNQAALAAKPIGPPAQFEPAPASQAAPAETTAPATAEAVAPPAAKPARVAKTQRFVKPRVAAAKPSVAKPRTVAAAKPRAIAAAKPRAVANRKISSPRRNPLDANASATKVQVWPCRSGALCKWR